jgi:hypothetical protein
MSGQPNRYANSADIFREKYMEALNSRANVDEFNLQANKNYKATGTLPPNVRAMVDNRTTTEILADSEKLKLNIIAELKPVMNSGTASVVVQKIQTAPANADGSFLIWVAQNINEIVRNLKKKYSIGIKGDQKDATNIVAYLSDMYSKIKDYSGTVKTYFDTTGEMKGALKEGDLDSLKKEYEVIVARIKTQYPNYRQPSEKLFNQWIIKTTERIQRLYKFLTNVRYQHVIKVLQSVNGPRNLSAVNGYNDLGKAMFELNDSLPSPSLVRALYGQLKSSLENKNKDLTIKIIEQIHDLFPDVQRLNDIEELYTEIPPDEQPPEPGQKPPEDYPKNYPFNEPPEEPPEEGGPPDSYVKDRALLEEKLITVRRDIKLNQKEMGRLMKLITNNVIQFTLARDRNDPNAGNIHGIIRDLEDDYRELENDTNDLEDYEQEIIDQLKSYSKSKPSPSQPIAPTSIDGDDFVDANDEEDDERLTSLSDHLNEKVQKNKKSDSLPAYLKEKKAIEDELNTMSLTIPEEAQLQNRLIELNKLIKEKYDKAKSNPAAGFLGTPHARSAANKKKLEDEMQKILQKKAGIMRRIQDDDQLTQQELDDLYEEVDDIDDRVATIRAAILPETKGVGLKKRRGRPKGSGISFKDNIDHAKGIQPVKKYHPFGKYFVNSHKLNNGNVLSIKSKSGTNIREYPSRTVSKNLSHVIKTIIGGGVPSWNDMEKLSNDEKDYLYKISKRAEFSDKITIPTPSKDQQEKDIHEFDVCKGEIMAGNDSKELIKKFKLLIIKLSKNGSIPKREASEVMQELLELGY